MKINSVVGRLASLFLTFGSLTPTVEAASVSLGWSASPDPLVTGYEVWYGEASGVYTAGANVGSNLSATVSGLTPGLTYYFVATSYYASGDASVFSNEITNQVPLPPSILTQPQSQTVVLSNAASFTSVVSGSAPLTIQWYDGRNAIAGATNSILSWVHVAASNAGTYGFTVSNLEGVVTSSIVTLKVVTPSGELFSDSFPGTSLSPWTVEEGAWKVANEALNGSSATNTLGYAYIGTNWTNYTVQASVRFSMTNGPWGGGIGGRLNTATGAHYAAWVYPEGSRGGSSIMNLIKWETWGNWSRIPMAQAKLPGVGTNWHTVALSFQGSNITASYDGTQEISVTDSNFSSMAPLASGGITADLYTFRKAFTFSVANVVVTLDTNAPVPNEKRSTPRLSSATNSKAMDFTSGPEIERLAVSSSGQVLLDLRGQIGQEYLLEMSTDLIRWQVLASGAVPTAQFPLMDETSAASDRRFYRVSAPRVSSRQVGLP
jgi:hypothetical protein